MSFLIHIYLVLISWKTEIYLEKSWILIPEFDWKACPINNGPSQTKILRNFLTHLTDQIAET